MSRLTLISNFDDKNLQKIKTTLVGIKDDMCKIPYINGLDREFTQNLPFHFTLYSWDENERDFVINFISKLDFKKSLVNVTGVQIMNGRDNSYVLYYTLNVGKEVLEVQEELNEVFHNPKYENNFNFHITICISKDYDKVLEYKKLLERNFVPFSLEVFSFSLFKIYPASKICDFKCV